MTSTKSILVRIVLVVGASVAACTLRAQCVPSTQRLITDHKYDEARADVQARLKRTPNDDAAMHCMGRILLDQGEPADAVGWFEKAVNINGKNADHRRWLGDALVAEAPKANMLRQMSLGREMKDAYEQAVALDPTQIDARRGLIGFYTQAPAAMGGSIPKAREQAAEILKLNPMRGHLALGSIADKETDLAGAEKEYLAAIAARPDSAAAYSATGGFYRRHERGADAAAMYDKALKLKPDATLASTIHYYLGVIHQQAGRRDQASAEFQLALTANPKNEDAKKALAGLKP